MSRFDFIVTLAFFLEKDSKDFNWRVETQTFSSFPALNARHAYTGLHELAVVNP